ncbi:MAG: sporulation protein YqfD [Lachnospiraceae bacterium]|nr:sporulation protein YqfD [Lachnospiraceae bacterium]
MKVKEFVQNSVRIKAQGTQLSRFLALLLARNILYQNAKYQGDSLFLDLPAKQYRQAVSCAKKAGVRIRIEKRRGAAFFFFRHRRRKWLLLLILPLVIAIGILPRFIWTIEIEGLQKISQVEMLRRLEAEGVHEGMRKSEMDGAAVREAILLAYQDLSWLSISVEGTVLKVAAAESVAAPEMIDRTSPCDLIADQRCVIYSIITEGGTPKVKQGDVVQEGDVLICGEVLLKDDDGNETLQEAHAAGVVFGKREWRAEEEMQYAYEQQIWEEKGYQGILFRFGETAWEIKNPFRHAEQEVKMESTILRLPLGNGLSISRVEHAPYGLAAAEYTREELEIKLRERLEKRKAELLEDGNCVILQEDLYFEETSGGLKGILELTVMEQIGTPVQR